MRVGSENAQLRDFTALCREMGEPEATVATAWTPQHPAVSTAIVGIHTATQLDGLVRAAELELGSDVVSGLEEIFSINRGRSLRVGAAPEAYSW
jgi:aryl-alcohol dehydrogenase-like predicted oxidoreductase